MAHWPVSQLCIPELLYTKLGKDTKNIKNKLQQKYVKDIPKNYSKNIPSWICCLLLKAFIWLVPNSNINDQKSAGVDLLDLLKKGLGDLGTSHLRDVPGLPRVTGQSQWENNQNQCEKRFYCFLFAPLMVNNRKLKPLYMLYMYIYMQKNTVSLFQTSHFPPPQNLNEFSMFHAGSVVFCR